MFVRVSEAANKNAKPAATRKRVKGLTVYARLPNGRAEHVIGGGYMACSLFSLGEGLGVLMDHKKLPMERTDKGSGGAHGAYVCK